RPPAQAEECASAPECAVSAPANLPRVSAPVRQRFYGSAHCAHSRRGERFEHPQTRAPAHSLPASWTGSERPVAAATATDNHDDDNNDNDDGGGDGCVAGDHHGQQTTATPAA